MAIAAVGLAISAYSAVQQQSAAKKARKAQERASKLANKQAQVERQRQIRASVAKSRVLRADAVASGFAAGIGGGASAVGGAVGSAVSTGAGNVGAAGIQGGLETARLGSVNDANRAISEGNQAAAFGTFGASITGLGSEQNNAALANLFA